jgi:hypothetical protein
MGKRWAVLPTSYGIPSSSLCAANDAAVGEAEVKTNVKRDESLRFSTQSL